MEGIQLLNASIVEMDSTKVVANATSGRLEHTLPITLILYADGIILGGNDFQNYIHTPTLQCLQVG